MDFRENKFKNSVNTSEGEIIENNDPGKYAVAPAELFDDSTPVEISSINKIDNYSIYDDENKNVL